MRKQAEQNKIAWEYRAYEMRIIKEPLQETAKEILDNPKSFLLSAMPCVLQGFPPCTPHRYKKTTIFYFPLFYL
jgi:hypothetical protein